MVYLIDTGFWIALYNPEKEPQKYKEADTISKLIINEKIIVPFPTLYEFLNSRINRRQKFSNEIQKTLSRPNFEKIADNKYKNNAYDNFFSNSKFSNKDNSLVDEIIKEMICDKSLKIDYFITFDEELKNFAISKGLKTN